MGDAIRTAFSHGQQMASLALIVGRVWARQKATEDSLELRPADTQLGPQLGRVWASQQVAKSSSWATVPDWAAL